MYLHAIKPTQALSRKTTSAKFSNTFRYPSPITRLSATRSGSNPSFRMSRPFRSRMMTSSTSRSVICMARAPLHAFGLENAELHQEAREIVDAPLGDDAAVFQVEHERARRRDATSRRRETEKLPVLCRVNREHEDGALLLDVDDDVVDVA